ncbi:hypothetical protein EJ04DRAFT_565944 [Polyplosphaeria fusca]|uniref:Uncharacterized protein n=1 Tax=Polyplosphaeria fusca TaxID=682080 RepID=A0A9P4QU43_9PLEO|nr:hypothetical protein EJ04DRAFT_565944 [Polyplosphaeria fusca]
MFYRTVSFWLASIALLAAADPTTTIPLPARTDVPPPPQPTSCLVNSFSVPEWEISSFSYSSGSGDVSFELTSNMDLKKWLCSGGSVDGGTIVGQCDASTRGNASKPTFDFDPRTYAVRIKQTWTCDSEGLDFLDPITFEGIGSANIPRSGDKQISVFAALTSPIQQPAYHANPPPTGHDKPGCKTNSSEAPSLIVSGFEWLTGYWEWQTINSLGQPWWLAHKGAAEFHLNVSNPATGALFSCNFGDVGSATYSNISESILPPQITKPTPGIFPYPPYWIPCRELKTEDQKGLYVVASYNVSTQILIDIPKNGTRALAVDQTWYCDDGAADHPFQFNAWGKVPFPELDCVPRTDGLPNDTSPYTPRLHDAQTCRSRVSAIEISGASINSKSSYTMAPNALSRPSPLSERMQCLNRIFSPVDAQITIQDGLRLFFMNESDPSKDYRDSQGNAFGSMDIHGRFGHVFGGFPNPAEDFDRQFACLLRDARLNPTSKLYDPGWWFSCSIGNGQPDNPTQDYGAGNWDGEPGVNRLTLWLKRSCERLAEDRQR